MSCFWRRRSVASVAHIVPKGALLTITTFDTPDSSTQRGATALRQSHGHCLERSVHHVWRARRHRRQSVLAVRSPEQSSVSGTAERDRDMASPHLRYTYTGLAHTQMYALVITEKVIVVLRDGRKLIGVLRSYDQYGELGTHAGGRQAPASRQQVQGDSGD